MDKALLHVPALCHFDKSKKMRDMAVHAAVGQKSEDVDGMPGFRRLVHSGGIGGIFEKAAVLDRLRDARQDLIYDAASADIRVTDLGVADLPGWQTHILGAGLKLRMGTGRFQAVKIRSFRLGDGIPRTRLGDAAAVHDAEYDGFFRHLRCPPSRSRRNPPV